MSDIHDQINRMVGKARTWRWRERNGLKQEVDMAPDVRSVERANGKQVDSRVFQETQPIAAELAGMRRYLPTLADLIDRLVITQQKAIFIHEHREEYAREIDLILHDVDLLLGETSQKFSAADIRATIVCALANRVIWENEAKARAGGCDQDHLLKFTHSVNGVRNQAKNVISASFGERKDWKIDCFAAELIPQFGNWNVW